MGKAKLTVEQVQQIRQQYAYGRRTSVIAKDFGISTVHVWYIAKGLRRKNHLIKT